MNLVASQDVKNVLESDSLRKSAIDQKANDLWKKQRASTNAVDIVYPGSYFFLSRIRIVSIPDPQQSILTSKKAKSFLSSKKYDPGCSSRIPDPGSGY